MAWEKNTATILLAGKKFEIFPLDYERYRGIQEFSFFFSVNKLHFSIRFVPGRFWNLFAAILPLYGPFFITNIVTLRILYTWLYFCHSIKTAGILYILFGMCCRKKKREEETKLGRYDFSFIRLFFIFNNNSNNFWYVLFCLFFFFWEKLILIYIYMCITRLSYATLFFFFVRVYIVCATSSSYYYHLTSHLADGKMIVNQRVRRPIWNTRAELYRRETKRLYGFTYTKKFAKISREFSYFRGHPPQYTRLR